MSLPSIEFLKDQANRLAAYMGDKHRMRLKASGALEAIAALYKQPDWNTLQAMARRADGESTSAAGGASLTPPVEQYPLTWQEGRVGYAVSENDWFRHTLVCGGGRTDRQTWLQQHLMTQLDRNGAGVFINLFGGELPLDIARAFRAEFVDRLVLLDLGRPAENTVAVNILAGLEPIEVAALLLRLLPTVESSPGAEFYRQQASRAVTVLAEVLQQLGEPVTLDALLRPCLKNGRELRELAFRTDPTSSVHARLQALLLSLQAHGSEALGSLPGRLAMLAAEPWARILFSAEASAPSLSDLLCQGRCVLIEGTGQDGPRAGKAEQLLVYALRAVMSSRLSAPRDAREAGWVFGLGELAAYLSPAVGQMAAMARAARIALLMTAANQQDLARHPHGQGILANVWNQLYLGGLDESKIEEIAQALRTASVALCQPGSVSWR